MRHLTLTSTVSLLLVLSFAVTPAQTQDYQGDVIVSTATNRPLASLRAAAEHVRANPPVVLTTEIPNRIFGVDSRSQVGGLELGADPLLAPYAPSVPTTILTQFDGSDNTDNGFNVTPPDTDGDVSSDAVDRYVQMINLVTTVFDKNGNVVPGGSPFFSNAFWSGFGDLCESTNSGDPIVLYDETSDRWLVSQFAFASTSSPPWFQCVAVSQTSNPLGAYNRYAFDFSSIGFPDYPKHGLTTESVTTMINLFNPSFVGTFIGAADKNCMYAGNPSCNLVGANLGGSESGFVAGDLDDPTGTAGFVPALFATAMTANGLFDVWEVDPDFVTPANTTITRISRVPISSFDSDLCTATRERCVPHPGPLPNLETLSGRLMHRLQIRDFGSHLSMVAAHTIDADAAPFGTPGRTGVRWYELQSTNGGATWSLHQEGTHAPADGLDRWMPSIAMNAAGDIGVGYMVSSATLPVEVRVAGQSAAASGSGTFDADEAECRAGVAGADWSGRAGDYSATNVDPDRDTFWHTNEYGRSTAFRGWGTAVCEFEIVGGPVNHPPVVTITAPANGSSFNLGDPVMFTGTAIDDEDGDISGSISWSSNLDGALGTGGSITTPALSAGTHTITASATDSGTPTGTPETGTDQITVTIVAPVNEPPVVTITEPSNGSSFNQGDPVTFTGTAIDPEDGDLSASIDWDSNLDGALGTGDSITTTALSVGTHTITASATDSGAPSGSSETGTDQITVTVTGPTPTTVHVHNSIVLGTVGNKNVKGSATVTIFDNFEAPVAGAMVTAVFSGDFNETVSGTTDGAGVVTVQTSAKTRNPSFLVCVDDVTHASLTYDSNDNEDGNADCGAGGTPTTVHVESIATGTQNVGGGNKAGTATVTLNNDFGGNPGAGYTVTGDFGGDIVEVGVTAVTDANGVASLATDGTARGGVSVTFCVSNVSGGDLSYDPDDNTPGTTCAPSAVAKGTVGETPDGYNLEQNYPNPFNPSTVVAYSLPEAGPVTLRVYNALGKEVAVLVNGDRAEGRHEVLFDASRLSAGVYLYAIEAGSFTATKRLTLLK